MCIQKNIVCIVVEDVECENRDVYKWKGNVKNIKI